MGSIVINEDIIEIGASLMTKLYLFSLKKDYTAFQLVRHGDIAFTYDLRKTGPKYPDVAFQINNKVKIQSNKEKQLCQKDKIKRKKLKKSQCKNR